MVIVSQRVKRSHGRRGTWTLELIVAMGILTFVMIPIGFSFAHEMKLTRAYYYRAVLMETIDGELEVLRAGEWKAFERGTQPYAIDAQRTRQLPAGAFTLTVDESRLRLEWVPSKRAHGGPVWREVHLEDRAGQATTGEAEFQNPKTESQ